MKNKHFLRNPLEQIRRWVVSPDLAEQKKVNVAILEGELEQCSRQSSERLDELLNETAGKVRSLTAAKAARQNGYYYAWVAWSSKTMVYPLVVLESALKAE